MEFALASVVGPFPEPFETFSFYDEIYEVEKFEKAEWIEYIFQIEIQNSYS